MNKRLLIIAGALTAFSVVAFGSVFVSLSNPSDSPQSSSASKFTDKLYQSLGIKSEAQMQQSLAANSMVNTENVANLANEPIIVAQADSNTSTQMNPSVNPSVNQPSNDTQQATSKTNAPSSSPTTQVAQSNAVGVSVQQARSLAQRAAPNAQFGTPELVRYSGKVAYEVISAQGNVYIDANTGAILDNGAAAAAQPRGYEGDDDDDEKEEHRGKKRKHHEEEDDDDDDDDDEGEYRRG